ncbi:hypothetical protein ElyMa_000944400 [Elysia marginata]|uniref:Uncharacterized protein n=1 Tax=Elysia marginata TaxID=1093978 RepID=A0AAV4HEH7_9GAST|nr:hypothetical protein ElyMa_000944400 [Elysia marginata]
MYAHQEIFTKNTKESRRHNDELDLNGHDGAIEIEAVPDDAPEEEGVFLTATESMLKDALRRWRQSHPTGIQFTILECPSMSSGTWCINLIL